jgi:hypothetical protein
MMMYRPGGSAWRLTIGATLLLLAACSGPPEGTVGAAESPAPPPPMQGPLPPTSDIAQACAGDIDRLCPGVPPGQGRIRACMRAHITELSAPCSDTVAQIIASPREP